MHGWAMLLLVAGVAPQMDVAHQTPADLKDQQGAKLLSDCEFAVKVVAGEHISSEHLGRAIGCFRYINGYTDGINSMHQTLCTGSVGDGKLAQVYVAFMHQHSTLVNMDKSLGLFLALDDSYHCGSPKKK